MGTIFDSLSGDWQGIYYYPAQMEPVAFEAHLIECDGLLTGTTSEFESIGGGPKLKLKAHLNGERSSIAVRFSKIYVDLPDEYPSEILYTGTVHREATRIEGAWTVPGVWSGTFRMKRARPKQAWFRRRWWFEKEGPPADETF